MDKSSNFDVMHHICVNNDKSDVSDADLTSH